MQTFDKGSSLLNAFAAAWKEMMERRKVL